MLFCNTPVFDVAIAANCKRAGSGWSSYSEVAAYMGGNSTSGEPLPMLMAGRDFGAQALVNPLTSFTSTAGGTRQNGPEKL